MCVSQWAKQVFAIQTVDLISFLYKPAFWLVLGAVTLAVHPVVWLVNTWTDPAYDSSGLWVFTMVVALMLWSWSSPRVRHGYNVKALARISHHPSTTAADASDLTRCSPSSQLDVVSTTMCTDAQVSREAGRRERPPSLSSGPSISSDRRLDALATTRGAKCALALLATSSVARMAGQLLAINSVAALTLVVDVYAIATLAGLQYRKNTVSPFWLASLFALSLPLERILQRTIGYGLQQLSAWGACGGLGLFHDEVSCQGVRILLAGQDVLVDLPCSGARGLLLFVLVFVVAAGIKRPSVKQAFVGLVVCIAAAIISNSFRIIILALGIAYPHWFGGINVMASPWHDLVGLIALGLGVVPLLWWGQQLVTQNATPLLQKQTKALKTTPHRVALPLSIAFFLSVLLILQIPAKPMDVARTASTPLLPSNLLGVSGKNDPLTAKEQAYFRRYGGGASRSFFGDNALLVVQTNAPLRHLHAPDECLRGSGHEVHYLGMDNRFIPTAVYRSVDTLRQPWRIRVSFVSDDGQQFHSVAAAVWHWLQHPGSTWSQIQRVTPWSETGEDADRFDAAVLRALDIPLGTERLQHSNLSAALKETERFTPSFPRSAWECRLDSQRARCRLLTNER